MRYSMMVGGDSGGPLSYVNSVSNSKAYGVVSGGVRMRGRWHDVWSQARYYSNTMGVEVLTPTSATSALSKIDIADAKEQPNSGYALALVSAYWAVFVPTMMLFWSQI